ncbi:hypothetical protein GGR57DRAFT_62357 [Xylariaceae sp. FL1272]|nr:hypothetical protein GGR57DRAFT_62357 [Xylariaceae sp. FL1272]
MIHEKPVSQHHGVDRAGYKRLAFLGSARGFASSGSVVPPIDELVALLPREGNPQRNLILGWLQPRLRYADIRENQHLAAWFQGLQTMLREVWEVIVRWAGGRVDPNEILHLLSEAAQENNGELEQGKPTLKALVEELQNLIDPAKHEDMAAADDVAQSSAIRDVENYDERVKLIRGIIGTTHDNARDLAKTVTTLSTSITYPALTNVQIQNLYREIPATINNAIARARVDIVEANKLPMAERIAKQREIVDELSESIEDRMTSFYKTAHQMNKIGLSKLGYFTTIAGSFFALIWGILQFFHWVRVTVARS